MVEPTAAPGDTTAVSAEARPTWSVSELSEAIGDRLRSAFPTEVWVRGEIQNFPRSPGYHSYFTLVDSETTPPEQLSVVLLNSEKQRVNRLLMKAGYRVRMTDGTDVRIRGRLDWYAPRGQLQLRMTSIDPAFTLGQLAAARAELLDRLRAEGILDANRHRPMPRLPLRVGVVTSSGSAAEADLLDELDRSGYAFEVQVADVRVQGNDAPASIAGAIAWFASHAVDVIVIVRGGGSATDLAAFDHEVVARAIAASPFPVVTGIGHETDRAVADEVSHTSAKTPTAVAQHLIGIVADEHAGVERTYAAVTSTAAMHLRHASERADRSEARLSAAAMASTRTELGRIAHVADRLRSVAPRRLDRASAGLDRAHQTLHDTSRRLLDGASGRVEVLEARIRALDPARALARGWSITRLADGTVLRSAADAPAGSTITTTVADGVIRSTVDDDGDQP